MAEAVRKNWQDRAGAMPRTTPGRDLKNFMTVHQVCVCGGCG